MRRSAIPATLGALALAGCSAGPDYAPPDLIPRTGTAWAEPANAAPAPADLATWWTAFGDAELGALVERAFDANLDLAQARERIIAARARRGIENAARLPMLDAQGSYTYAESGDEAFALTGPPSGVAADVYSVGVVAGWELDLWGRVGRLVEAADAEIAFAVEDYHAARAALAAEVAREIVAIRAIDERLGIVRRSVELRRETLEIAEARRRAGFASELDALRARRDLEADQAALPPLLADRHAAAYRVAVLLGLRPGEVSVGEAALPAPPGLPALGLPAELIVRRPDIRRAERALAAETARIGAAMAERYPRVSLSGQFALSASDPGGLADARAGVASLGPTVTLPILSGGRIGANISLAEANARAALAELERTTLDAVREVETAVSRRVRADERVGRLREAVAAALDAETLAQALYAAGNADFLAVLEARERVLALEEQLTLAEQAQLAESINLFTALGGGWPGADDAVAERPAPVELESGS